MDRRTLSLLGLFLLVSAATVTQRSFAGNEQCRQIYSGFATVAYQNGQTYSHSTHVTLPANCPNPSIVTQSYQDSIACGTTSGPQTCVNNPGTTSTDVHSYVNNITNDGFDVFLSGDDNVWVGSASPAFPIAYKVVCGDANLPVCHDDRLVSGIVNTTYFNNTAHSQIVPVNLPSSCINPSILTQTYKESTTCGNGAGMTACNNNPGTTSTDLHAYIDDASNTSFTTFLSADDTVHVGASSPQFPIAYHAMCQQPVGSNETVYAGVVNVKYVNGRTYSNVGHVSLPNCPDPHIVTQTYQESVQCGNGSGPQTCINNPGTTSTDVDSYVSNINANGFDVFLSADDNVWVGAASPNFPIAYHVTCQALASSSSSSSSSSSTSSTPGCASGTPQVKFVFDTILNKNSGNMAPYVHLPDGSVLPQSQWIPLNTIDSSKPNKTVAGFGLQRLSGNRFYVRFAGNHQPNGGREIAAGKIFLQNAEFTGLVMPDPEFPVEGQGDGISDAPTVANLNKDTTYNAEMTGPAGSTVGTFNMRVTTHEDNTTFGFKPLNTCASSSSSQTSSIASSSQSSVIQTSNVSVTKSGPSSVTRTNTFTYTLSVSNSGPGVATNVIVIDTPSSDLIFVPQQSNSNCGLLGDGTVQCSLGTIGVGTTGVTLAFKTAEWQSCSPWTVTNRARVTASNDATPSGESNTVMTTVNCPGASSTSSTSFSSSITSSVSSTSSISSLSASSLSTSSFSSSSSTSSIGADISISKSGPSSVIRGNTVTYNLTVSNAGPATATNIIVTDPIPSGFTFQTYTSNANCSVQGSNVVCTLSSLASGQNMTVGLVFNVPTISNCSTMTAQNTATVTSSLSDPQLSNNTSQTISTTVTCGGIVYQCNDSRDNDGDGYVDFPADSGCTNPTDDDENNGNGSSVTLTKTVDRSEALPGDVLQYTVIVRNDSNNPLTNVMMEDTMDSAAGASILNPEGAQVSGTMLRWSIGTIEARTTRTYTYTVRLGYDAQGYIMNRVLLRGNFGEISATASVHILEELPQTGFFTDFLTPPSAHLKKIKNPTAEESSSLTAMTLLLSLISIATGGAGIIMRRKFF